MGTRCREMKLGVDEAERLLYSDSGLLGVSGISNDMRELRAQAATNPRARLAIDLFVYRIGRELGSLIAALGGIDLHRGYRGERRGYAGRGHSKRGVGRLRA
jgi:acetate kinase